MSVFKRRNRSDDEARIIAERQRRITEREVAERRRENAPDPPEPKPQHGGKRKGAGRKPLPPPAPDAPEADRKAHQNRARVRKHRQKLKDYEDMMRPHRPRPLPKS